VRGGVAVAGFEDAAAAGADLTTDVPALAGGTAVFCVDVVATAPFFFVVATIAAAGDGDGFGFTTLFATGAAVRGAAAA
jgi:hypothetical protein